MNVKKLLAAAMACALTLSLSVPAFATPATEVIVTGAGTDGLYGAGVEVGGETQAPSIKVTVPTTGKVIVNPYKMEVTIPTGKSSDQLISAPLFIKNESDVAIAVNTTVTGKVSGGALFATASTAAKSPLTKSVFMYLHMVPSVDDTVTTPDFSAAYDSKATNMVLVGAKATTKTNVQTLAAGNTAATYAAFKLIGDAASAPTTPWTSADKVDVTIAFTFAPTVATTAP